MSKARVAVAEAEDDLSILQQGMKGLVSAMDTAQVRYRGRTRHQRRRNFATHDSSQCDWLVREGREDEAGAGSMISFVQFLEKLLNPTDEQRPWILLLDCASVHTASAFRQQLHSQLPWVKSIYIPGGSTAYNQPLDRSMMKSFKSAIARKASRHFAEQILLVDSLHLSARFLKPVGFMRSSTTSHPDAISSRLLGPTFSRTILRRPHRSCSRLGKRTRTEVSSDRARRASYQRQHRSMMNQSSRQSQKMSQSSAVSSWTKKNQHHRTLSHRHRWSSRQSSSEQSHSHSPRYQPLFWSTAACRCWSGASRSG